MCPLGSIKAAVWLLLSELTNPGAGPNASIGRPQTVPQHPLGNTFPFLKKVRLLGVQFPHQQNHPMEKEPRGGTLWWREQGTH